MSEVNPINIPNYKELSVKALWPQMREDPTFMLYMPDEFAEGKGPAKQYFFDILNTLYNDFVIQLVKHA